MVLLLMKMLFLLFTQYFFDSIKLDSNAEKVSDSDYFNTLYCKYKAKYEKESSNLDPFMQIVRSNQEDKNKSYEDEEAYTAVEGFLDIVLRRKIRKNIKSKASKDKSLTQIVKKEDDNKDYRTISFVVSSLLSLLTAALWTFTGFNPITVAFIIVIVLCLSSYTISCFTVNKLSKSENKELKDLPANFKSYICGGLTITSEDFFSPITFDYLDDVLNDSEVYLYLKEKYNKREWKNGIVNE